MYLRCSANAYILTGLRNIYGMEGFLYVLSSIKVRGNWKLNKLFNYPVHYIVSSNSCPNCKSSRANISERIWNKPCTRKPYIFIYLRSSSNYQHLVQLTLQSLCRSMYCFSKIKVESPSILCFPQWVLGEYDCNLIMILITNCEKRYSLFSKL